METLTLDQIQTRYEAFENHKGVQAINKAINKVLAVGKTRKEMPDGTVKSNWVNSAYQQQYHELVERRNEIINGEFYDIENLLKQA